jgi:hypothetical protein
MSNQLDEHLLRHIPGIISALKKETQPLPGHDDPEAIQDCWKMVEEGVELMIEHISSFQKAKLGIEAALNVRKGELEFYEKNDSHQNRVYTFNDIQKNLTKGFINAYTNVLEALQPPSPLDKLPEKVTIEGNAETREVWVNGEWLDPAPSLAVANHSPDGFNWGYSGSGPAQLALAILLKYLKPDEAQQYKQLFKRCWVATIPQGKNFNSELCLRQLLKTASEKKEGV